uniref:Putative peptide transporter n=1 Tax=Aegilops tauschii TaxID=37682 RepID=R7VYU3_AEGTA
MDAEPRRQQQEEEEEEEGTTKEQDSGDGDGADAEPVHNHRGWKERQENPTKKSTKPETKVGWGETTKKERNETFEKLGTIGTLSNMLVYLTTVYHMQSVSAATLLNVFSGTSNLATVLGAFVSDTYLGRYTTIAISIVASFLGMLLLTLTAALPSLHPPTCNTSKGQPCQGPSTSHFAALLASFFFLVVGASGVRPCSLAFGADQFDPRTADGRRGIASFFNWYYFTFTIAIMLSATVIIYLQSNVNWALGLAVPAVLMGISCVVFFMGTRLYVRVRPEGSPLTSFAQVLVAATRKRHLRRARGVAELFDLPHRSKLVSKLAYTDQFTCLDKAAMRTPEDALHSEEKTPVNPWRLCTVQQVEEVKCLARIIPVWSSGTVYFVVLTQLGTYVVLQAAQTDRRISSASSFQIPQGSLIVFSMLSLTLWIPVCCVAGLSEAFAGIGQLEFFYRQFPENMRSVAGALYCLGFALASYASGVMVTVVHRATRGRDGRPDWLAQDLDQGRVDLFYLVTAAIAAVNLIYFIACARWYRFKESNDAADASHANGDDVELVDGRLEKSASAAPV